MMNGTRFHTAVRAVLLLLQLELVVASIPHFHQPPASEVPTFFPPGHGKSADHPSASQSCQDCVLGNTWIAEAVPDFGTIIALPLRGFAIASAVSPGLQGALIPAYFRGPPLS